MCWAVLSKGEWRVHLFRDYRAFLWMLLIALSMVAAMAVLSSTTYRVHPDEFDHIAAARFYLDHWFPPPVADPRTVDSYSYMGASYLNEWDVVYFLAGKFVLLMQNVVPNDVYAFRMFNVLLFCILVATAWIRRSEVIVFSALLCSPQTWYLYSYFNADAFAMFLAMLTACELVSSGSRFNDRTRPAFRRYLLLGTYVGLLVISKRTFWMFGLFVVGYLAIVEIKYRRSATFASLIRGLGVFLVIVICVAAPRVAYDLYVNGMPRDKAAKIRDTANALGNPGWRPTDLVGSQDRWNNTKLRERGVTLYDLLVTRRWIGQTLQTTFGGYGYRAHFADSWFYVVLPVCFLSLVIWICAAIVKHGSFEDIAILGWALLCCFAIGGLSVYHSWVSDFQPEGRYLLGIFVIVGMVLARSREMIAPMAVHLLVGACFILSAYSFFIVGIRGLYWERFSRNPFAPGARLIRHGAPR